jgi:hypothetical protein
MAVSVEPTPAPPALTMPSLSLGAIKTVFELSWKAVVVLWFVFQFYSTQTSTTRETTTNQKSITDLNTKFNEMDRRVAAAEATASALKEQMAYDRQFILATQPRGRDR